MPALRVVIAGGGTGGHLYPGIAVAQGFQARYPDTEVHFIGMRGGLEERLVPREGFPLHTVAVRALTGRSRVAQVRALGTLGLGIWQALGCLRRLRPHLVIGCGGYVMGPAILAAALLRLPRVILEQNVLPGLTVRALARYAHRVFTAFPETQAYLVGRRVECTGTPIRQDMCEPESLEDTKPDAIFHVLVFGGSQGAHRMNQAMVEALPLFKEQHLPVRIVHQTGEADFKAVLQAYRRAGVDAEVHPFLHDMAARYRWAHLVVCRAGASTLAELMACGKPAILVPYPYAANDHQRHNAMALQREGAARVILDADLTGQRLATVLQEVMSRPEDLTRQAAHSRRLGKPQATDAIVNACLRLLEHPGT